MTVSPTALIVIVIIFGFLTGSSFYFYNRSRPAVANHGNQKISFSGDVPKEASTVNQKVDSNTTAADPKGRLSYPANTYKIQPKESLFGISQKFGLTLALLKRANNITDENLIQADFPLVIPKLDTSTDYYRINFLIDQDKASELNRELRDQSSSDWFDPIAVAKKTAVPYFSVTATDSFTLAQADLSQGKAAVEAKAADGHINVIGLVQPKVIGKQGLWALLYVEDHE